MDLCERVRAAAREEGLTDGALAARLRVGESAERSPSWPHSTASERGGVEHPRGGAGVQAARPPPGKKGLFGDLCGRFQCCATEFRERTVVV
jgi:hypothetical protein